MSFPGYASYRDSGTSWIGEIPSDWQTRRLRTIVEIKKRIAGMDGLDVLSITQRGIKVRDLNSNDGQLAENYAHYQRVEVGDFAMNHMDLLTGWIDLSSRSGVTSPDYRVFSLRTTSEVDPRYLLRALQNCYSQRVFYALGQGASHLGRWRLPTDAFQDFEVPLPPIIEQRSIAAFLDRETAKTDALLEEQRRLIELLKEKRQSVISHAVTKGLNPLATMKDSDVEWMGQVPAHWQISRLSHVCGFQSGKAHEPFIDEDGGFIYVSARFVSTNGATIRRCSENFCPTQAADILMVMSDLPNGRALARAFMVRDDAPYAVNQRVCRLRPIRDDAEFLAYQLDRNPGLLRNDDGVNQTHLSNGDFTTLPVLVPPLEEQKRIGGWLHETCAKSDALVCEGEAAIEILEERRAALISAAVTGKIDVRGTATKAKAA